MQFKKKARYIAIVHVLYIIIIVIIRRAVFFEDSASEAPASASSASTTARLSGSGSGWAIHPIFCAKSFFKISVFVFLISNRNGNERAKTSKLDQRSHDARTTPTPLKQESSHRMCDE